jgi:hypothetical protein
LIQPISENQIVDLQNFNDGFFYFDLNGIRKFLKEDNVEQAHIDTILEEYSGIYALRISENQEGEVDIVSENNNRIGSLRIHGEGLALVLNDGF